MKIYALLFLIFLSPVCFAQDLNSLQNDTLKQKILSSKELADWQQAMILHQKSNQDLCALKSELNETLFVSCGKPNINDTYEETTLRLFRTLRITEELRDSIAIKEKVLRAKYPELASHSAFDEIFLEMYALFQKGRGY